MKRILNTGMLPVILLVLCTPVQAQLWKKIKEGAKNAVDQASSKPAPKPVAGNPVTPPAHVADTVPAAPSAAAGVDYANYDFVAGDRIIFQPDVSGEADAELPSHFIVTSGKAEMQTFDGEKVLHLDAGTGACVLPMMNSVHYLPDQFTLEFDILFEGLQPTKFEPMMDFLVTFHSPEDENYNGYPKYAFRLSANDRYRWAGQPADAVPAPLKTSLAIPGVWHHVAIYLNKALGKVYIDQYRLAATNAVPQGAGHLAIHSNGKYGLFIRNVRIAEGGDDKYKKIITEGKFITHGILFDVNKATIRPESTGALREIATLMKAHTDLQFEIDGHTDSDGSPDGNMRLSQQRADAVKEALVRMGIDAGRLTTKGFGASKPMDTNGTAEGKANNRRVEFVRHGAPAGAGAGVSHGPGGAAVKTAGASRRPCCWIVNYNSQANHETGPINVLRKGDGTVWTFRPGQELQQVPGLTDVVAIAAGAMHVLALKSDGTVWGWGMNHRHQLCVDYTNGHVYDPVQVQGITDAVAITTDESYTCYALLRDGSVVTWGSAAQGMAGDGGPLVSNIDATKNASRNTPVRIPGIANAIDISGAYALLADGTVMAWGDGQNGRLGNGSIKSSPVPVKVSGITNAVAISCGYYGGTAELADGSLWAWGMAWSGMLGNGKDPIDGTDVSGSRKYSSVPVRVKSISHPLSFSGNHVTHFALMANGDVLGWGDARLGGIATKSTEYALTPMKLAGLHDVVAVQSGNMTGFALQKDGTVMGWGTDVVKDGLYKNSYTPVRVASLGSLAPQDCAVR
ncbi:MAG TPA: OmpA family protein [Puia sp.]|nr:OmpA family protein [Puia sp.]